MTPTVLTDAFRRRLLALVAIGSLLVAVAPPTIYYVQKRSEIVAVARADAERIAAAVTSSIQARPKLWRYGATKLGERLRSEGFERLPLIVVHDANGSAVPLAVGGRSPLRAALWGRAEVRIDGRTQATVWVGADAAGLLGATAPLAFSALLAASLLAILLYRVPVQAIQLAERRIAALHDELSLSLRDEERKRIARDLHDGAGQALTAARLHLAALDRRLSEDVAKERLAQAVVHIDEAIDEVRRSTTRVEPALLGEVGLAEALERHAEAFGAAAGIEVRYERPDDLPTLQPPVALACFRIVQEALHNVVRHSGATRASLGLTVRENTLYLEVRDNGRDAGGAEGDGLPSIRDRAIAVGGRATFTTSERGSIWNVELPLR